jgi:hypothetical protein
MKIIKECLKHNDKYYIEYSKCPDKLLTTYEKFIIPTRSYAKRVIQTNQDTKNRVIFNSLSEISLRYGYTNETIKNAIKNKTLLGGYVWDYYDEKINDDF